MKWMYHEISIFLLSHSPLPHSIRSFSQAPRNECLFRISKITSRSIDCQIVDMMRGLGNEKQSLRGDEIVIC